jgi:hypothetical protein
MQNKYLFFIAIVLIGIGLLQPSLISNINMSNTNSTISTPVTDAPTDTELFAKTKAIVDILQSSNAENKKGDFFRLSCLYADMSTLIAVNDDTIIKDTVSIREANILCGKMLKLNLQDKYSGLAEKVEELVLYSIGDDDVVLDSLLRQKAVDAFKALSWAFYKGSQ